MTTQESATMRTDTHDGILITCNICNKKLNGTFDYYTIGGYDGKVYDACNAHKESA